MKPININAILVLTSTILLATGCTAVNENVISTVNTGFGLQVAENPQSQLYEIKFGYMRNQFYSIPTSKRVTGNNDASITNQIGTPQVVSGIGGSADINGRSLGGGIAENFAVGETAVASPAAVMMYMATARTTNAAIAMSEAIKAIYKIGKPSPQP